MIGLEVTLAPKMDWYHLRSVGLLLVVLFGLAAARHCNHNHFWDSKNRICRPCAKCPQNEIIRKPCSRLTDTVCGPFREFNLFKEMDSSYSSYDYQTLFDEENSSTGPARSLENEPQWNWNEWQNEPIVQKDDGEYWKNLAFALIGVVCVLIFVATVVVLMACRKLHETAAVKRPEEDEDDDSGYVVIRAIRPPNMVHRPHQSYRVHPSPAATALLGAMRDSSSQDLFQDTEDDPNHTPGPRRDLRLKSSYKPKRRLLNYDADDVFESEDSSGSRTSRKLPLQVIPERSTSSDTSDNAGNDGAAASVQVPV